MPGRWRLSCVSRQQLARLALAWLGLKFGLYLVCSKPTQCLGRFGFGFQGASEAWLPKDWGPQPAAGTMNCSTEMPTQVSKAAGPVAAQTCLEQLLWLQSLLSCKQQQLL